MSGWRDTDGRTPETRRRENAAVERARFLDTLKRRPQTFVKPVLFTLFVLVIAAALLLR
ncbi:MAG: hypothetical protein K2P58_15560 [Hyphomonadaceae bacterium]|nr:hypothetical protein [Hyphomonadaceae bacterium]